MEFVWVLIMVALGNVVSNRVTVTLGMAVDKLYKWIEMTMSLLDDTWAKV